LLQASVAFHVRVTVRKQAVPLVTVLTIEIVALPQVSLAVGASKLHATPHSTILPGTHVIVGGSVSRTVTVWLHSTLLLQASVAFHVRVAV
jgi:hypothetical protein